MKGETARGWGRTRCLTHRSQASASGGALRCHRSNRASSSSSPTYVLGSRDVFGSLHTQVYLGTGRDRTCWDSGWGQGLCSSGTSVAPRSWFVPVSLAVFTTRDCRDAPCPVLCKAVLSCASLDPLRLAVIWSPFCKQLKAAECKCRLLAELLTRNVRFWAGYLVNGAESCCGSAVRKGCNSVFYCKAAMYI